MSKSDDDFVCPDCVGDGEVQCVNLGPTYRSDTLPCPTCIAHEIEQERASKADEITRLTAEVEKLNKSRNKWGQKYNKLLEQHKVTVSLLQAVVWSAGEKCKLLTAENEKLLAAREVDVPKI